MNMDEEKRIEKAFYRHCTYPSCYWCRYGDCNGQYNGGECQVRFREDVMAGRVTTRDSFKAKSLSEMKKIQKARANKERIVCYRCAGRGTVLRNGAAKTCYLCAGKGYMRKTRENMAKRADFYSRRLFDSEGAVQITKGQRIACHIKKPE